MKVKGTIVITDPCYLKNAYEACLMHRGTNYGDWSCMVYPGIFGENEDYKQWDEKYFEFFNTYNFTGKSEEEKEKLANEFHEFREKWLKEKTLGEFCADAGSVGVFEYDKLSDKNKLWIKEHPWCAAIIEDFQGDVDIVEISGNVHVIGGGNKHFFSTQSGL